MNESHRATSNVLIIEDDVPMRRFLRAALENEGHQVTEAGTARDGMTMILGHLPDLVLLDLGLPDADGMTVLGRVREWSQVPVVILSARGQEVDKVDALNAGADDYLTKPFGVPELLARVRVALRHSACLKAGAGEASSRFEVGDLAVDLAARRVTVKGADLHLTRTEYRLLVTFVKNAGKVLTHRYLLQEVWGPGCAQQTHYPRMYVANLRRKLEEDPAEPRYLLTEQGVGYRFTDGS